MRGAPKGCLGSELQVTDLVSVGLPFEAVTKRHGLDTGNCLSDMYVNRELAAVHYKGSLGAGVGSRAERQWRSPNRRVE
jgi:hypothetical protein